MYKGHETLIRAFPISVDFHTLSTKADTPEVEKAMKPLLDEYGLNGMDHLIFGLDRIDYTKGILERIRAVDRFLEKYPEYKGRIAFVQMGDLSRIHLQQYKDLNDEINAVVEEINWKHSKNSGP